MKPIRAEVACLMYNHLVATWSGVIDRQSSGWCRSGRGMRRRYTGADGVDETVDISGY